MVKILAILLFSPLFLTAQDAPCDVLLLKKKGKTIRKYFSESTIFFFTTEGMKVYGTIECITRDSIFLYQQTIKRIPTPEGGIRFDTSNKYKMMFSLANIGSFPAEKQKGKNLVTDGTLLMIGGAGYLAVNLVNTTLQGDPPFGEENLPRVIAGAGAVAGGFLLRKLWPARFYIGKKYQLQVLKSQQNISQ